MKDEEDAAEEDVRGREDAEQRRSVETRTLRRSEFDFINSIRRQALRRTTSTQPFNSSLVSHPSALKSSLLVGIGDDAAVIRQTSGRETILTADLLVEDIDFRRDTTRPYLLGHKALAVSLSDIAAMGARPRWALVSLGVPRELWDSHFLDDFYEGFFALADHYRVALVGGDVSRTPERIVIDSVVMGETIEGRAVLRAGARPGDHIFVTGTLGGAAAGLRLLERGARLSTRPIRSLEERDVRRLLLRHLRPEPRSGWGALLGAERLATAMIDLSDGLSSDIAHLCRESRTGALLEAARLPLNPAVERICGRRALDPLALALHGGEDFELLFTVNPRDLRRLPRRVDGVPATYIGDVTRAAGRVQVIEGRRKWTLRPAGFMHFSQ